MNCNAKNGNEKWRLTLFPFLDLELLAMSAGAFTGVGKFTGVAGACAPAVYSSSVLDGRCNVA